MTIRPRQHRRPTATILWLAAAVIILVLAAGGIWWFFGQGNGEARALQFVSTLAGLHREFGEPFGVAVKGTDIYISDGDAGKIWIVSNGSPTLFAEGFGTPSAIAFNKNGDLIVTDSGSHTVKLVNAKGEVSVLAGTAGKAGFADGNAANSLFDAPIGIAVGGDGRVFVADTYNDRIRVIENGQVTTLAGSLPGFADGAGKDARLHTPTGIAIWHDKLLVADTGNGRLRVVEHDGRVWTLAGDGNDDRKDGMFTAASFVQPTAIAIDANGTVYISDGNSIRAIGGEPFPLVRTISGKERSGLRDGKLSRAKFSRLSGLAVTSDGSLIVADSENRLVRELTADAGHQISADEITALRENAAEFRALQPPRWPYDPPDAIRDVAGTLGEIRGEIPEKKDPARFHNGLDIAGSYGETARFVRSEKVLRPIAAENFGTLREFIRMPTMGYIHIRLGRDVNGVPYDDARFQFEKDSTGKLTSVRIPRGAVFKAGEPIGTLNQMNHVHLIAGRSGTEINALDALILPGITDTRAPTIESVSLYDENWQQLETTPAAQRIKLSGKAGLVIRAFDQMDGNSERRRLGVYKVGYQILNSDASPAGDIKWTIVFDRMPSVDAVKSAYGPGSHSGATGETIFNYIATNEVEGDTYREGFLDTSAMNAGAYTVRAFAADEFGNMAFKDISFEVTR
jgi:sugar lactone lactonase YvrE